MHPLSVLLVHSSGSALAARNQPCEAYCARAKKEDAGRLGDRGGGEVDGFEPFICVAIIKNDVAQAIHCKVGAAKTANR